MKPHFQHLLTPLTCFNSIDNAGAKYDLTLWPTNTVASTIGSIVSKTFLSSTAAFAAFSTFGALAPQTLVGLVGRANSLYWMGYMSGNNMPESFRSFTNQFETVTLPWK